MSAVKTFIGNIKGPKGDTGATGPVGEDGKAAGVRVGTVQTVSYGSPASVTNSGTENEAVLDFQIPQGAPGSEVTDMASLGLSAIEDPTAEYPAFAVGENGSTIFGKIRKYLSDLKTNYLAKSNLVNGFTQTAAGTNALDAAAGKTLNDSISSLKTDLTNILRYGQITMPSTVSIPANSIATVTVTYDKPLTNNAAPIFSIYSQTTGVLGVPKVALATFDKNGFTAYIYIEDPTSSRRPSIYYFVLDVPHDQKTLTLDKITNLSGTTRSVLPVSMGGTGQTTVNGIAKSLGTTFVTQTDITLPSAVSVPANNNTLALSGYNPSSLIPSGATLLACRCCWADNGNIVVSQSWMTSSRTVSARLYNPTSSAISVAKVTLELHYKL